jgi:hypothetical protein
VRFLSFFHRAFVFLKIRLENDNKGHPGCVPAAAVGPNNMPVVAAVGIKAIEQCKC